LQLASLLAAVFVVCAYLTYGIDRSLWLDEANTVHIANGLPGQIVDALSRDGSPPLYYFFLSGWMRLFGDSEIPLRILSVLFYLAGICLLWFLGRMLLGAEGAASAAFIYAVNPIVGRHAQNVRMYTMLPLMSALSLMLFVILIRDKERRTPGWFALFGLVAFLGLNTHYWFAFVLVAYGSWVIFSWRSWTLKQVCLLGLFTALPFLAVDLAMFLHQSHNGATSWTAPPSLVMLVQTVAAEFGLFPLRIKSAIMLSLPILWTVVARRYSCRPAVLRSTFFLGFLYAVALGVPFLISLKRPIFYVGRYDVIAVPFFALFAASLLLCLPLRPRILFHLLLAGSCGLNFVQSVRRSRTTNWLDTLDPVPLGDRSAASTICAESAPGDFVVYTGLSRAAVSFYLQRFGCSAKLKQVSYPAELEQHMGWQDEKRDYSDEPPIKLEAENIVATAHASRARIFLLFHPSPRLSAGIVAPIELLFRTTSSRRFASCAYCFDELRVYAPNAP
jgi:mannosyltransferase